MATFYLVRHGKHNYDSVLGRNFIGHGLELAPLTEEGVNQAVESGKRLLKENCNLITTSPYTRAMQTASILSKYLGLDIEVEIDLREHELDLTYQVKSFEELKQIAAEEQKYFMLESEHATCKWEPREMVKERVLKVLKKYNAHNKVIVVTHGMVIHCLTGRVGIPNCAVSEFELL
jgi:broad specificity phosphatase PhoE